MKLLIGIFSDDETFERARALGRFLSVHYNAFYAPFYGIERGIGLARGGILSLRPELEGDFSVFGVHEVLSRDPYVRNTLWRLVYEDCDRVVIPDLRSPYDVSMVHMNGGIVLYFNEGEKIDSGILVNPKEPFGNVVERLKDRGIYPSPRKPRVYVGGSMYGVNNYNEIFSQMVSAVEDAGMDALLPIEDEILVADFEHKTILQFSRDVVAEDLLQIATADAGIFYLSTPSMGSAIEIVSLALMNKPAAIIAEGSLVFHPFLHAFGKVFWGGITPIEKVITYIKSHFVLSL